MPPAALDSNEKADPKRQPEALKKLKDCSFSHKL
jgi:hypothetical protein